MPEEKDVLLRGLETFAELGYDHASARELARRLGVSHNFINDRYGSKAAFWRAVMDHALSPLARLPQADSGVDDAERLRQIITSFYRSTADTPLVGHIFVDESSRDTERLDYLYERYVTPVLQLITPSIERLVASGRMTPIPMHVLFFALIPPVAGMVDGPMARRLGRPEPDSSQHVAARANALATLVVNGLLGTSPQAR